MSARLFAFVILIQRQKEDDFNGSAFLPLLRTFVDAEISSLKDIKAKHNFKKKKLHFCSIDNSSMITPVDTEEQSESIIEGCIESFQKVLKEAETFMQSGQYAYLRPFVTTLQQISDLPSGHVCFAECAKVSDCGLWLLFLFLRYPVHIYCFVDNAM